MDTVAYTCATGSAAPMRVPTNGGLDPTKQGTLLSDAREMLILFRWDGVEATVHDVDYVTWGAMFDVGASRIEKTTVSGYKADTAAASQQPADAPLAAHSIVRCDAAEKGETLTGGNGLTGHDETSEALGASFKDTATPTPGTPGGCQ